MILFGRYPLNRSSSLPEFVMQEDLRAFLSELRVPEGADRTFYVTPDVMTEVRIGFSDGLRIPDIVLHFSKRKIACVECKMEDLDDVVRQAEYHLSWADYSYVCVPMSVVGKGVVSECLRNRLGLIAWDAGVDTLDIGGDPHKPRDQRILEAEDRTPTLLEILDPPHNRYEPKGKKRKPYRNVAMEAIGKRLSQAGSSS